MARTTTHLCPALRFTFKRELTDYDRYNVASFWRDCGYTDISFLWIPAYRPVRCGFWSLVIDGDDWGPLTTCRRCGHIEPWLDLNSVDDDIGNDAELCTWCPRD